MFRVSSNKQITGLKTNVETKVSFATENVKANLGKSRDIVHTKERLIAGNIEKTKKAINKQKAESSALSEMSETLIQNTKSLNILHSAINEELSFEDVNSFYSDYIKTIGHELRNKIG